MVLEAREIERLMARKKAIQATLAAEAQKALQQPQLQGGCSGGGCGSAGNNHRPAPRKALLQGSRQNASNPKSAVLLLSLLRVAGLAAAAGVGVWALVQAL